jgi:hypothetical protein
MIFILGLLIVLAALKVESQFNIPFAVIQFIFNFGIGMMLFSVGKFIWLHLP